MKLRYAMWMLAGSIALGGAGLVQAEEAPTTQPADNYPLTVCIVSGGELGSMGDPIVIQHEGRTVKFCCEHCVGSFKKNPQKYLKKLDEAEKAAPAPSEAPSEAPSDTPAEAPAEASEDQQDEQGTK